MGSYNYLGFAENNADFLKTVAETTLRYGVGVCSTRQEVGESVLLTLHSSLYEFLFHAARRKKNTMNMVIFLFTVCVIR